MRVRLIALATALLVAGTSAITAAPPAVAADDIERLAGADRYATSVEVSQAMPVGGVAYLASGLDFPDALAAAPVAAAEDGRLLLVRPEEIPPPVAAELRRVAPREVVLVGSTATLSAQLEAAVRGLLPGTPVTRIGGSDRVETSLLLLDRLRQSKPVASVWVVSGLGFADALTAGAVAARLGHGLILATGDGARLSQLLASRMSGIERFAIAGSPASVSAGVADRLRATGRAIERFGGHDRYDTALLINQRFTTSSPSRTMLLASGENFPDGLAGSVLAGRTSVPMYLTPQRCAPDDAVLGETRRLGIQATRVLGDAHSVSAAAAALVPCTALTEAADALLALINDARADAGSDPVDPSPSPSAPPAAPLPPLATDACLARMAGGWAATMAAEGLSGAAHNPQLTAEARECGLRGWGENVGRTWGTPEPDVDRIMAAWMASPGHRANILRESFTHIGIGVARGTNGSWYYVLDFGRR